MSSATKKKKSLYILNITQKNYIPLQESVNYDKVPKSLDIGNLFLIFTNISICIRDLYFKVNT